MTQAFAQKEFKTKPAFFSNLEEVSYLTGLRDFSQDCSSKIWAKLFVDENGQRLLSDDAEEFLKNFEGELLVDKSTINAYDYALIKNPVHRPSPVRLMKSVKQTRRLKLTKTPLHGQIKP